jgi:ATP-dependent HslUV protease subunit HslV
MLDHPVTSPRYVSGMTVAGQSNGGFDADSGALDSSGDRFLARKINENGRSMSESGTTWHGTTILSVRKNGKVVIAGDGQVTLGNTVIKSRARKVRRLSGGSVIAGFAGATADAFTLFERLEAKLEQHPAQLTRACVELAKDWRTDRYLRRLSPGQTLGSSAGTSGSGGSFALSAARALIDRDDMDSESIARRAMEIAAGICIYTNENVTIESL